MYSSYYAKTAQAMAQANCPSSRTSPYQRAGPVAGGGAGPDQILEAGDHRAWTAESPVRLRLTETGEREDGDQDDYLL